MIRPRVSRAQDEQRALDEWLRLDLECPLDRANAGTIARIVIVTRSRSERMFGVGEYSKFGTVKP